MENVVIDLSHHNSHVDFVRVKAAGIFGVIHKATQGMRMVDPEYSARNTEAIGAGLRWGAYHFGTGGDGVEQAEHFLDTVRPAPGTLLVLDLEDNPQGPSMTLQSAREFVSHVHEVTGQWPGLYSGSYIKKELGVAKDPILANCWFWLAQYGPSAHVPPNWPTFTLWQYTDGAIGNGPHQVDGVGRCDRNLFNGTMESLQKLWKA